MKKIFLFLPILALILSSCDSKDKVLTYTNSELGIEFDYPEKFGQAVERKDSDDVLTGVTFDNYLPEGGLEINRVDEKLIIEDCSNISISGVTEKCETMMVRGHPLTVYQGSGQFDSAQMIQFQTKQGVWSFTTGNPRLYEGFLEISKTMRYLD